MELTAQYEEPTSRKHKILASANEVSPDLQAFMRNFGDEKLASEPFIYMPTLVGHQKSKQNEEILFLVPGTEGCASILELLCAKLNITACVLQLGIDKNNENFEQLVDRIYAVMKTQLTSTTHFKLLGHSFGSVVVMKLAAKLESEGYSGIVFCVDGSPKYVKDMLSKTLKNNLITLADEQLQFEELNLLLPLIIPVEIRNKISHITSLEKKVEQILTMSPKSTLLSKTFFFSILSEIHNRFKMVLNLDLNSFEKLESPVVLLRCNDTIMNIIAEDDYGLNRYTYGTVIVHRFNTNHRHIIDNKDCVNVINSILHMYK